MVAVIPQAMALKLQLVAIAGGEDASRLFELRPLTREMGAAPSDRAFIPASCINDAMKHIIAMAPRLNVYIGAAPRVREDGTASAVEQVSCLWADLDSGNAMRRLAKFHPLPTMVIRTGSEDHGLAIWALRQPISPAAAQRSNRRLALALDGDMAATDPARIVRPVGTLNHKYDPPREVVCTRLTLEMFTFDQVIGGLPDSPHYRTSVRESVKREVIGDASRTLAGLVNTVAEAQQGNRNCALHWAVCRVRDHSDRGELDRADALAALRAAAEHAGLGELEIERTIHSGLETGARAAA